MDEIWLVLGILNEEGKFVELEEEAYPEGVSPLKLTFLQKENEFDLNLRAYTKINIGGKRRNSLIAIKLPCTKEKEVLSLSLNKRGFKTRVHTGKGSPFLYYIPPEETSVFKFTGDSKLRLSLTDGKVAIVKIKVRGANKEERDFYQNMIDDLLDIDEKLAFLSDTSVDYRGDLKETLVKDSLKQVERFSEAYFKLENQALPELRRYEGKVEFRKLKKITPKAMVEHFAMGREKVTANLYEESFDTFEHRLIKGALERLKEKLTRRKGLVERENQEEKDRITESFLEYRDSLEDLKRRREDLKKEVEKAKVERAEKEREIRERVKNKKVEIEEKIKSGELLEVEIFILPSKKEKKKILILKNDREGYYLDFQYFQDYIFNFVRSGEKQPNSVEDCGKRASQFFKIYYSLETETAFLLEKFIRENQNRNREIYMKGYGRREKPRLSSDENYVNYSVRLEKLTELDGEKVEEVDEKFLVDFIYFKQNGGEEANQEERFFLLDEIYQKDLLLGKKDEMKKEREEAFRQAEEFLQKIEMSPLMAKVGASVLEPKMTNLFSFHPEYRQMYELILKLDSLSDEDYILKKTESTFPVTYLYDLYERWCLIKILSILILDYDFKLQDKAGDVTGGIDALRSFIKDTLKEKELSTFVERGEGLSFTLVGEFLDDFKGEKERMELRLFYNKEILFGENPKGIKKRKPDIRMQIVFKRTKKEFFFDTKFREDGYFDGLEDLFCVAYQKYTRDLSLSYVNEPLGKIGGSFILHNCVHYAGGDRHIENKEKNYYFKFHPKKYLGTNIDGLIKQFYERIQGMVNRGRLSEEQFEELKTWAEFRENRIDGNAENKLGLIAMKPGLDFFHSLFQMIMEHHFGLYFDRCWLCGKTYEEDDIEVKLTGSDYPKYHIHCRNPECKSFMIRTHCRNAMQHSGKFSLGKHLNNYYALKKDGYWGKKYSWIVSCPYCRDVMEKTSEGKESQKQTFPDDDFLIIEDSTYESGELPF